VTPQIIASKKKKEKPHEPAEQKLRQKSADISTMESMRLLKAGIDTAKTTAETMMGKKKRETWLGKKSGKKGPSARKARARAGFFDRWQRTTRQGRKLVNVADRDGRNARHRDQIHILIDRRVYPRRGRGISRATPFVILEESGDNVWN